MEYKNARNELGKKEVKGACKPRRIHPDRLEKWVHGIRRDYFAEGCQGRIRACSHRSSLVQHDKGLCSG